MKSDIEYYYNLNIDKLDNKEGIYYFNYYQNKYYFVVLKRPVEDLEDILQIVYELKVRNILCHEFILNINNKIITTIDNINYVMLKINDEESKNIELYDILNVQKNLKLTTEKSKLYRNNWAELWSEKIDYFEYQVHEIGKEKSVILNSFSYYVGLAENAISYVNNTNDFYKGEYELSLSHKRLYYPNYSINYYNPLTFIFDLRVRDIAEYAKSKFFKKEKVLEELEMYFNYEHLSNYEFRMFYARLLYPSYYFDLYEEVMNNNLDEEKLVDIIALANEYEMFLASVYKLILKYTLIDEIDWLIKKDANFL